MGGGEVGHIKKINDLTYAYFKYITIEQVPLAIAKSVFHSTASRLPLTVSLGWSWVTSCPLWKAFEPPAEGCGVATFAL